MAKAPSIRDDIAAMAAENKRATALETQSFKDKLAAAHKIIEQQQDRITNLAKARFTIPSQRQAKTSKGCFTRLIVPDTHGSAIDPRAAAAMLADIAELKPREIVHLGDAIDCGGFLAQHHVWGYVAEAEYTFEQDVAAANVFFDKLQALAPKATIHYLEGNHDRRIETWCVTQSLRNRIDAAYLKKMFGVATQLHIEQRGIHHWEQGKRYMGCRIPATIRLGNCFFTHGTKHGKNAAAAMLQRFAGNVVFGHVHKLLSASDRTVKDGEIGAWCPGSLCVEQPLWRHSDPTDWCQGYGVQLVRPSGDFLHVNVPIIDGESFLMQLLGGR
jgi:predicted phosphodiesterase